MEVIDLPVGLMEGEIKRLTDERDGICNLTSVGICSSVLPRALRMDRSICDDSICKSIGFHQVRAPT